ncbi:MAG: efflux RND transporter periplasmic adaptor subunit [Chitinophagaceae bacterium]|nr:efflux RND transporter periplasmic adaptor subunit [Chitinophagaceae bacterium]
MKISKLIILKSFVFILAIAFFTFTGCRNNSDKKVSANAGTEETYTCPMHPQIIRHEPGNCPICGMPLVKKENASREISEVDLSTLLQSDNNTVVSSIPVTTMQFSNQEIQLDALGSVEYDTRFMKTISARVSGRIEKLYIKYRYQPVRAGDKVMDIYSPELSTGQQNLLFLIKNDPTNTPLINAAKQRLLLLGMNNNQLQKVIATGKAIYSVTIYSNYTGHVHETGNMNSSQQIIPMNESGELSIKEGMYVEKGQPVFQVNNMNNVWVTLNLFPGENSLIKVGTPVTIIPETAPDKKILSKIGFIEPFYKDGSKTVSARVYLNNSKSMIPVGSQVKATLNIQTKFSNWLPKESVLSLGLNKIVFLKKGNVFKAHQVNTGIVADNLIQVTDGLDTKDSVAINAQFLIDSEGFIKLKQ